MNLADPEHTVAELLGRKKPAPARMINAEAQNGRDAVLCGTAHDGSGRADRRCGSGWWHWAGASCAGENRLHYRRCRPPVNRPYDVDPDDRQKVLLLAIREATRPRVATAVIERSPTTP
jgi:hypothetical protein